MQSQDASSIFEKQLTDDEVGKEHNEISEIEDSDGGWRAWTVVFGVWICQFCNFGYINAYGVYNDFYVRVYLAKNYTSSQISWIGSVQLLIILSSGLLTGSWYDKGYFYPLMIGGSLLLVFCLFTLSLTKPEQYYQIFLAQGLGMGIAVGITYVPCLAIISHYFRRHRAFAMGVATSGSAVGGALHPIMLNSLLKGRLGFQSAVRASAGMIGGLLLIALILIKPRTPPRSDGASRMKSVRIFLYDLPYMLTVFGTALVFAGAFFPIFFLQLNAVKIGIDSDLVFYSITMLNAAGAVGRIVPNLFVPRFGVFNVIVPCSIVSGVLIFCNLAVKNVAGTVIFALFYGFFNGAFMGLLAPMIASLAQNDSEIGARMGVCFTVTGVGALVGTPIAGALLSTTFVWWKPTLFAGLCVLAGSALFSITQFTRSREMARQCLQKL